MGTFTITRSPVTVAAASAIALAAFLAAVSLVAPSYAAPHQGDRGEAGEAHGDRDEGGRGGQVADRGADVSNDARFGGNLNAAHANANALEHANSNSMVGQIAAYKAAVEAVRRPPKRKRCWATFPTSR